MILWHPDMQITKTKITYIHRGAPENIKQSMEIPLKDWTGDS